MPDRRRWFQTTAIDYPNSRPHIGTAFEKLGADVQGRYRRMEGYEVFFLMGNDENTVKVSKRAAELGLDVQAYCDDMAKQFRQVWDALDIQYDAFVQTSESRHHRCAQKFIQQVYDNGYIRKDAYEGWYCDGCEAFKSERELTAGKCPLHANLEPVRRSEPCYFFELSKFQDWLLEYYDENPEFIQPESRRNEIIQLIKTEGLQDVNITRRGEDWGIRLPFDPEFTIYVWFDALLTYITGIGYGADEAEFAKWWPCDMHFIGKDITRFHCALWPAMLKAAGIAPPRRVFGHGFVYKKNEETGVLERFSKSLGNVVEPMEIVTKFSSEAFRYYFLRECPFPSDGEFGWARFAEVYNGDLANNLGNLLSRCITVCTKSFNGVLEHTTHVNPGDDVLLVIGDDYVSVVDTIRSDIETNRYHVALQHIFQQFCDPANRYLEQYAPWKLLKTGEMGDRVVAKLVVARTIHTLRTISILLKPFLPRSAEAIYTSFNFPKPWSEVNYADAANPQPQTEDLRVLAQLDGGKVKPLFPRIG